MAEVEPPPPDHRRVFYLTGAQFAVSDIALQRIKIARFSDLNDPFELLGVDRSDLENRSALLKQTKDIDEQSGLICFSGSWKNPVLWGHYAEKHTGICMGFDVPESSLHEVVYAESMDSLKKDKKTGEPKLTANDLDRLKRTKFKDWAYEEEMRMFVPLGAMKSESGKYFYPFSKQLSLREVVLGARCEIKLEAIRRIVDSRTTVQKARLAFRSFSVVPHKNASRIRIETNASG
jgi:hypothetical protein